MTKHDASTGAGAREKTGGTPAPHEPAWLTPRARDRVVCRSCGFANLPESLFCGRCRSSLDGSAAHALAEPAAAERSQAERRQLTVLFCDLVDSTRLAGRIDPEELRDLIRSYQEACTSVIRRFDGTVSRYMGDGILVLFGYPHAHEDDPERAVRAGLDIVRAIAALPVPRAGLEPLAVRIGIATGLVVVGDLIGEGAAEEMAVVGETPNLAARLQSLASPNSLIIAASTRMLVGERFDYMDLGTHALKGFSDPVRAWRVLAARFAGSRFEAAQPVRITPLVGREEHLSWLLRLWRKMGRRRGRVVLLSGDAGIGKSRVVQALREQIADTPHAQLHYQCSPHYVNTALHPVIDHMERAAGIGREDAPSVKLAKLSTWPGAGPDAGDAVPLLGSLLSIPADPGFPMPAMSPQRQKERTFELLVGFMQRLAAAQPLLVVFEDVHWVDPTTQEFLTLLIERARHMHAFVVLTFRPDYSPPWSNLPFVEHRELLGLAPEHAMGLAEHIAGERGLSRELIDHVVAKTDGVPLFVEELTRAILGTGLPGERQDQVGPDATPPLLAVPSTLQDSLMARLDQLGPAKHVAQIAGTIGREFNYELLEAVWRDSAERLHEGLVKLEQSGLVHAQTGLPGGASYAFKHALVQEVAYQSMLRSSRRELHLLVAEALESRFPQTARDAPELVAHHWTEAGNAERAVAGWLAAGRRASARSEYREAISHLTAGLALCPQLADPQVRRDSELALQLALGPALITTEGGGAPQVGALYARALELCDGTPESASHFAAHWGWWRASMDLRTGRERADRMFTLARSLDDPALRLQAHHCQWATLYMVGAHGDCLRHIEHGLQLYERERDHSYAVFYGGHDALVCALGERSLVCWLLGHADEALGHAQAALDWANELHHVGSRAHAIDYALVLHKFRRDAAAVHARAGELIAYAAEQHLRDHHAKGQFYQGWARAMQGDPAGGLKGMLEAMDAFEGVGTPEDVSVYYEMLAEVYAGLDRHEDGLRAVADAFAQTERCGILFWNAELHRRRGELLLASCGDADAAATCFRDALGCARAQGASSLELRAALSLARLHCAEGVAPQAGAILRRVCEGFPDTATPDAMEARALLERIS